MKSLILIAISMFLIIKSYGQDYSGIYKTTATTGQTTLMLKKNGTDTYTGTLSGNNNIIKISGQVQNGLLKGRAGEEGSTIVIIPRCKRSRLWTGRLQILTK